MNFLINTTTKSGLFFSLELSDFVRKDALNEYYDNKIIIQFYSSNSFFLLYKRKRYKGILLSSIFFNCIKKNIFFKKDPNTYIEGILVIFQNLTRFQNTMDLFKINKILEKRNETFLENEKLLKYLIDRKKKLNS